MKKLLSIFLLIAAFQIGLAQQATTRKDSLQGGLRPERTSYNVLRYDLNIKINS